MSMVLCLAKMPHPLAERIKADPELLFQVWNEAEATDAGVAALDPERDKLLEDYLGLARIVEANPGRYPWLEKALHGTGVEVDYDYGYGPGFVITALEAAQIVEGLAGEGWWRAGEPIVAIDHAIAAFYASASRDGHTVIGWIS